MKKIILSSAHFAKHTIRSQRFEVDQLIRASKRFYDKYFLVFPPCAIHHFQPENKVSKVSFHEEDISDATSMIVRSTAGCEEATQLLVQNLYANQCEILDPLERFHGIAATKSFMTLKGLNDQTIPPTFIAFTFESAIELLSDLEAGSFYPIIGKPTNGKRGRDVQLLRTPQQAKNYIHFFFKTYPENSTGIIFQKYIEIKKEYRVLLIDGHSLGVVEKMSAPDTIARNSALGCQFVKITDKTIEDYAIKNSSHKGLLGSDIVLNKKDECYLIETNRSPEWQSFEKATGVNVAEEIMLALEKRIAVSSELF